jgi:inhibitor of KinA sporulation pathway (predicted exonuclease)
MGKKNKTKVKKQLETFNGSVVAVSSKVICFKLENGQKIYLIYDLRYPFILANLEIGSTLECMAVPLIANRYQLVRITNVFSPLGDYVTTKKFTSNREKVSKGKNRENFKYTPYDFEQFRKSDRNLLFLDFEMNIGTFKTKNLIPEIIQYGFVLTDSKGKVISSDEEDVEPKYYAINQRTVEFLSLDIAAFHSDAITYEEFLDTLNDIQNNYNPLWLSWGDYDFISLFDNIKEKGGSLDISQLEKIDFMRTCKRFIKSKSDVGLFKYASELFDCDLTQLHSSLTDAKVMMYIFKKQVLGEEVNIKEELKEELAANKV